MKNRKTILRLGLLLLAAGFAAAGAVAAGGAQAAAQNPARTPKPLEFPIEQHKLANGLRVVFSVDHSAPVFGIAVTYDVGSRNERPGRTGFAHLFEHMMFEGSENVGKGEHFILILNNGGGMNGTTNEDRTNYFEELPANQLDLALFLESDRMRSLAVNQANLDNQRKAVKEERRLGIDNQPYGSTDEALSEILYDNFAYKHSVIGSMADLDAASVDDVKNFFRLYYAPNNAVLTLVGDFNPPEALAKINKYFGSIASQPTPPRPDLSEPPQTAERRRRMDDTFAQTPRLDVLFKVSPGEKPDWFAVETISGILGGGQSSRLYQRLVKEKELAVNVETDLENRPGPSPFQIQVSLRPGASFPAVEQIVQEELDRLQKEPVAAWELEKVRLTSRRERAERLRSSLARAFIIGEYTAKFNDPELINTYEERLDAVTPQDVERAAQKYLTVNQRCIIETYAKQAATGGAQ
ncbi:MAG TPA: pitrilysin family protein [Candidatus Acidoferrales bacterium]|nr:pitrilysin family protein [Candidatus Acidoferrales bacterium]